MVVAIQNRAITQACKLDQGWHLLAGHTGGRANSRVWTLESVFRLPPRLLLEISAQSHRHTHRHR